MMYVTMYSCTTQIHLHTDSGTDGSSSSWQWQNRLVCALTHRKVALIKLELAMSVDESCFCE